MAAEPTSPKSKHLGQIEMPEREIMTVQEVAEYLRVNRKTVTNMAAKGVIPGKQIGKLWRFSRKTIKSIL